MNKKSYIKWQIKELLPMYIISFIILATIFWLTVSTSSLMPTHYVDGDGGHHSYISASTWPPLFAILIPALLVSLFLPFFSFSYQRKRTHADFYYQLPFKKNELRRTNLLISYTVLAIAITIIYWIGVLFIFIKQFQTNSNNEYFIAHPYYYNYLFFLPYYFALLVGISLKYFISSFFISLGTRNGDTLLYLVFGQLSLAFFVESILFLAWAGTKFNGSDSLWMLDALSYTPSPSWLETIRLTIIFAQLTTTGEVGLSAGDMVTRIVSSVAYLLLGCFLTWYILFKKKDPSGEDAGKGLPTTPLAMAIPHIFALMTGLYTSCGYGIYGALGISMFWTFFPSMLMSLIMWGVAYYFFIVVANATFHFKKINWIIFSSVTGVVVILGIVYLIIFTV